MKTLLQGILLGGLLLWAGTLVLALLVLWQNPTQLPINLAAEVHDKISLTGVDHPVTAVLLNYRAYDTLLEIGVLLLAVLGVWTLANPVTTDSRPGKLMATEVTQPLLTWLLPTMVLSAGYLLWAGAVQPGGAFQAGALLSSVGILLLLDRQLVPAYSSAFGLRLGLTAGLAAFAGVGLGTTFWDLPLLTYPQGWEKWLILSIETLLTLSISLTLVMLYSATPGLKRKDKETG